MRTKKGVYIGPLLYLETAHMEPSPSHTANVFKGPAAAGSVRQTPRFANSSSSIDYISGFSTFDAPFVSSKVGISWISVKKACQNVNDQIPAGTKFSAVVQNTKTAWNTDILSKITTTTTDYIRSMIEIWRFDGHLPAGRSSNYNGRSQGRSNADNVLADAYVMGVRGGVHWNDGYAAMVKDAEVTPPNTNPLVPMAPDASTKEGRGALPDWLQYDFITPTYTRTVSRAVEYAYNDFSLFQSLGFSGFVAPKNLTGFIEVDELNSKSYWGEAYCQSSAWGYSWAGVHDMGKIIDLIGGANTTLRRLQTVLSIGADPHTRKGIIYDATDEPTFNVPYLCNYVGRQDRSVYQTRGVAKRNYKTGVQVLAGNSDADAMQTWILRNSTSIRVAAIHVRSAS
ncbi:unnamed protein product [Diplocarpon coronariae]